MQSGRDGIGCEGSTLSPYVYLNTPLGISVNTAVCTIHAVPRSACSLNLKAVRALGLWSTSQQTARCNAALPRRKKKTVPDSHSSMWRHRPTECKSTTMHSHWLVEGYHSSVQYYWCAALEVPLAVHSSSTVKTAQACQHGCFATRNL